MFITNEGIICHSRQEIFDAQAYIKGTLKKHTVIKLAAPFAPWTSTRLTIDTGYVTIDGGGIEIDATGALNNSNQPPADITIGTVPSGTGAIFQFNNTLSDNSMSTGQRVAIRDVRIKGPGVGKDMICFLYSSTTGMGDISTYNAVSTEFGCGDFYGTNAYLIHHFDRGIFRCSVGVYAQSASNSGEGLHYYGGNISNGSGVAILNSNGNAGIRCFGTSIDYIGRAVDVNAGCVNLDNCHIELCNAKFGYPDTGNKLAGIPFDVADSSSARLIVNGGIMLTGSQADSSGTKNNALTEGDAWINVVGKGSAVFRDVMIQNIRMATPDATTPTNWALATINPFKTGTGKFIHDNVLTFVDGSNDSVHKSLSDIENLTLDGSFTDSALPEWYVTTSADGITDKLHGANITLVYEPTEGNASAGCLRVNKISGNNKTAGCSLFVPIPAPGRNYFFKAFWKTLTAYTADTRLRLRVDTINFSNQFDSKGTPIVNKRTAGNIREIQLNGVTVASGFHQVFADSGYHNAPEWATHYQFTIDVGGLNAGSILFDDLQLWAF